MQQITEQKDFLDGIPDPSDPSKVITSFCERYPGLNASCVTNTVTLLLGTGPRAGRGRIQMIDNLLLLVDRAYRGTYVERQTYYLPYDDTEVRKDDPEGALLQGLHHWKTLGGLFGNRLNDLFSGKTYLKAEVPQTECFLAIRKGHHENENGLEIVIGNYGIDAERRTDGGGLYMPGGQVSLAKDYVLAGMYFDTEGVRIVNIQGGYEMKDRIRKKLPKELGFHPLNVPLMLAGQWITERGGTLRIVPDARLVEKDLKYDDIASNLGLRSENDWHVMGREEFQRIMAGMTPRQHDLFDNLSRAWDGLRFYEKKRQTWSEENPFTLSRSPEVIEKLIATGRYAIRRHFPGFGATRIHKGSKDPEATN